MQPKSLKIKSLFVAGLCNSTPFNVCIIKYVDWKRHMSGYTRISTINTASSKKPAPPFPSVSRYNVIAKRMKGGKNAKETLLLNFLMFRATVDGNSG